MVQVLNQLLSQKQPQHYSIQTDMSNLSLNANSNTMIATKHNNVHLVFANKTTKDIIWQQELDNLEQNHKK